MAEEEPADQPLEPLKLIVEGFKCFRDRFEFELAPLTVLAGANSSGKTSAMQPLLLLKQTLEATFDPGPLWIGGPIVQFDNWLELVWALGGEPARLQVGMSTSGTTACSEFACRASGVTLERVIAEVAMPGLEHVALIPGPLDTGLAAKLAAWSGLVKGLPGLIRPERFAAPVVWLGDTDSLRPSQSWDPWSVFRERIGQTIHLPGLRGNPRRSYPLAPVPARFVGSFQPVYVAGVLWHWQQTNDDRLQRIADRLQELGLTWKVQLRQFSAIEVQILVGRLPGGDGSDPADVVNIADVGLGVSQVLPVLVALEAAERDQIVIIEQPELHLHPRAQAKLAEVLIAASKRGVRVVVETHSALLLLALQSQVARGELPTEQAVLYWFRRDPDGAAKPERGLLDESGAYGDWPVDFDIAESEVQDAYLDAAWRKLTPR